MGYLWIATGGAVVFAAWVAARWLVTRAGARPVTVGMVGLAAAYVAMVVLIATIVLIVGLPVPPGWFAIELVTENSASVGKLAADDRIIALDHEEIRPPESLAARIERLGASGRPITVTYERAGVRGEVAVQPMRAAGVWRLGIVPTMVYDYASDPGPALRLACAYPARLIVRAVKRAAEAIGGSPRLNPGGPKRIVERLHDAVEARRAAMDLTIDAAGGLFLLLAAFEVLGLARILIRRTRARV